MKTLIVIPTYNEKENIKNLILKIKEYLQDNFDYSILVVDDNSLDGTREVLDELVDGNLFCLKREGKYGLASAYIDGFKYGISLGYDSFIQMDADLSHNPKYLKYIFEYLNDNDVVVASRNIKGGGVIGWSVIRNLISKGGSLYSKIILNCPINDLTGGFNAWKKDIIDKINLDSIISKGYSFQIEMKYKAYKNKAKIKEFPIIFEERKCGKSKMSKKIFFEAMLNILLLRFKSK